MDTANFNKVIESLEPLSIFDYYDGPMFYSCRSPLTNSIFVILWVSFEEEPASDTWMYVEMSESRYTELVEGRLEVKHAFIESESASVYLVTCRKESYTVEEVNGTDLDPEILPVDNYYLDKRNFHA